MNSQKSVPVRAELLGKSPYGAPEAGTHIALNVNENPYSLPEELVTELSKRLETACQNLNRYPDRDFLSLRKQLANYLGHQLTEKNLWAANGSNEVLQQVLQAFAGPGRTAATFEPSYAMYPILATSTNTAWLSGSRDADFQLTPEKVKTFLSQHAVDVLFLCSPNNPTGTMLSHDTIIAAYESCSGIVVVDEAYAEFASHEQESALALLPGRERLVVSRSMSKAFGFAGVRLGYLAADPLVIDALQLVRLPYHLSSLTQAAATTALEYADTILSVLVTLRNERERLAKALSELGYFPSPSSANFVLFRGDFDSKELFVTLRDKGILVRDVGIANHIRVSVGTVEQNTRFLHEMSELTGNRIAL